MTALSDSGGLLSALNWFVRYLDEHIEHKRADIARLLDPGRSRSRDASGFYSDRLATAAIAQSALEELQGVADTLRQIISAEEDEAHSGLD
jgi:hypothetical protein